MARSTKIYVVQNRWHTVVGAFTVKHELITWLEERLGIDKYAKSWRVHSVDDGISQRPEAAKFLGNAATLVEEAR